MDDSDRLESIGRAASTPVPDEVLWLAQALSRIHGRVVLARESGGSHLYMASPALPTPAGDSRL